MAILAATLALVAAAALLVGTAVNDFIAFRAGQGEVGFAVPQAETRPSASGPAAISLHDEPRALPDVEFAGAGGIAHSLADFRGKVVLLNLWATWCLPCREEIPSLDRLQAEMGGADFEVVALSIDRGGEEVVRDFFNEIGVSGLALHIDASGEAAPALNVVGLPTTLLIDREGRELGRLVGPAEWDAPDMIAFLADVVESQVVAGREE